MKIELKYNAEISVYSNYRNETVLNIENNNLLPEVLVEQVLLDYGVEPLVKNLYIEDIKELILQLNDLYEDEFEITIKEK